MIPRIINSEAIKMAQWFPVLSLTGPRQSGKSTLLQHTFPEYDYLNLEQTTLRKSATEDPVGFINTRTDRLFIDEAQYAPQLFDEIQVASDKRGKMGQYLLSGSQNFLVHKKISESLAGRVGIMQLLPLSFLEIHHALPEISINTVIHRGEYPHLYDVDMPADIYYRSYVNTYIQRAVAEILDVRSMDIFTTFLRLCAQNAGQLLNISNLAKGAGIAFNTAKEWLSILSSSYIITTLSPHFANPRKRLIKTPKLYFYDTGLLCYLLDIPDAAALSVHPLRGAVFENFVIAETIKYYMNQNKEPRLYFYRDSNKVEVDLVDRSNSSNIKLIEIKSGQTPKDSFCKALTPVGNDLNIPIQNRYVVYAGMEQFTNTQATFIPVNQYALFNS